MIHNLQVFPVYKQFDEAKQKWKKIPGVPKGTDWHDYKATVKEIKTSKNIGVVIPNNVVVFDLDTYKGVTTDEVDAALGVSLDWEAAELQRTVTGGVHYAFAIPDNVHIRQGDNLLGVKGFDTRTTNKGWICSGEGYQDLTLGGLLDSISPDYLPELPKAAIDKLSYNSGSIDTTNELADLEDVIGSQPIEGLTLEMMQGYIDKIKPEQVDEYTAWLKIGMACHHQLKGSKDALRLWVEASKKSQHYNPDEIKAKWRTFGNRKGLNQVTFRYVMDLVGGRDAISEDLVESLLLKAQSVESVDDYETLKKEVRAIDTRILGSDLRGMIAAEVALNFGKDKGMTRTDIKRALEPQKNKSVVSFTNLDKTPKWAKDWVYVEITCEFANTDLGYAIKREAFNAKYNRQGDCMMNETIASSLVLDVYNMPTVVDKMFFPGADTIFEYEGKRMLNTYRPSGVQPCSVIDDDGQDVVDLFLQHVYMLIEGEKERQMLLDWMAYVIQNPGQRVNWALLLQGAQGIGKTYFINVLQLILGDLVTNLDPQAINGRFTGWAHGSLVVGVEEIRVVGANRFESLDRMKPFITNPTVQIEEKGRDHRTVANFTSYFLLTNHKDAIPLTAGDRRYGVIFSRIQSEEQLYKELGGSVPAGEYFAKLFSESQRRSDALARWFLDYPISNTFEPKGRAPETDARRMMMDVSVSPERSEIEDALVQFECDVINDQIIDVTYLNELAQTEDAPLPKTRALSAILLEMGYQQIAGRRIKVGSKAKSRHHYIWVKVGEIDDETAKEVCQNFYK